MVNDSFCKLDRSALIELHRLKGFTRLENREGILYAKVSCVYEIEGFLARFFSDRFSLFPIVIESQRGFFVCVNGRLSRVVGSFEDVISGLSSTISDKNASKTASKTAYKDNILHDISEVDSKQLWKKYYNSQFIKSRENKRYFLHNVPKKFHAIDSLQTERDAFIGCKKLDEFF